MYAIPIVKLLAPIRFFAAGPMDNQTDKAKHPPTLIARKQDIPQPKPTPTPFKPSKPCHPYLNSSERALQLSSTL